LLTNTVLAVNKATKYVEGSMLKIGFGGNNMKECDTMNSLRRYYKQAIDGNNKYLLITMSKPISPQSGNKVGFVAYFCRMPRSSNFVA